MRDMSLAEAHLHMSCETSTQQPYASTDFGFGGFVQIVNPSVQTGTSSFRMVPSGMGSMR
jgi:hypothetical protein